MLAGVRFNQLGFGDPLINKNWSYKGFRGLGAAKQKLVDQFNLANDCGFQIIYDSIRPVIDIYGKLSIEKQYKYSMDDNGNIKNDINGNPILIPFNNGGGYNSFFWPLYDPIEHNDRISFYKSQILTGKFKFICQIEFPESINSTNIQTYSDFLIDLIKNPDFSWIENWQIGDIPEQFLIDPITHKFLIDPFTNKYISKISPIDYVTLLNKVRTVAKLVNPSINIGGPGIRKALGILDPNNYLHDDNTFYHSWLLEAIECGLLNNIDFFSTQLQYDIKGLDYDNIFNLSNLLKKLINKKLGKDIPIYSINQGRRQLNDNSNELLQSQAYYNTTDFLNTAKNGIIPILNCMIDFPSDLTLFPEYVSENDGYGLCSFNLTTKPQFDKFKFILNQLKKFTTLTIPNKIYNNDYADNISFINNSKEDIISIVWSKYETQNTIIILPNPDEYYTLSDGIRHKIINPYEFNTTRDFIVVTQHLNLKLLDYDDIKLKIFKQYMYNINFRNSLLKHVPNGYNIDTDGTNFYKILRAFALEFSDAKIQVDTLKDNYYLDTAHKDAIYQNFGTLVDLKKQSNWNYEKYRKLIKGVIKSLLAGPTNKSIQEAINLFINYNSIYSDDIKIADITIRELYNDKTLDPVVYDNVYPQFAFIVEVNKNIDTDVDQDSLNRDLKYIINILKPAHTLSFVIIILTGTEDYKKWYYETHIGKDGLPIEFKDSDEMKMDIVLGGNNGIQEGIYGWKHLNYPGAFHTFNPFKNSINAKTNGGILIGPRYTLYENSTMDIYLKNEEDVNIIDNMKMENGNVLRYGYYHDNQDSINDVMKYNPITDTTSVDYKNPDSGEYYKYWWLKSHKIKPIINSSNFDITKITDDEFNEIHFDDTTYIPIERISKPMPLIFQLSGKNKQTQLPPKLETGILDDIRKDVSYNIKFNTAQLFKYNEPDKLPPEIKIFDRRVLIDPLKYDPITGEYGPEVSSGLMPYNNVVKRAFIEYDSNGNKFYFEDMIQCENIELEYDEKYIYEYNNHMFKLNVSKCNSIDTLHSLDSCDTTMYLEKEVDGKTMYSGRNNTWYDSTENSKWETNIF